MIRLEDVSVAPGGSVIVQEATFHVRPGDHVGWIGRNGSGKTTLLRAIVGEASLDRGRIAVRPNIRLGWLPQQAVSGSSRPVWDEVRSRMDRLNALRAEVDDAQRAVEADPHHAGRLAQATERFRLAGGYAADERIGEVLHGLGFPPDSWHRTCDTFSGGWQMRIALARLLLSEPDVALLDEPTNHLDLEARTFLAEYLRDAPWAFVVVSHDRWLLDRCVTRIGAIEGRRLHDYPGNFSRYLVEREQRRLLLERTAAQQGKEIAHLERFVERFGASATKAAQAKSKQKALDRIERVERPDAERKQARIRFPEAPAGAHEALGLVAATIGWDGPVLSAVDVELRRGERVALLGPNGCGKSTLLQTLAGKLKPLAGRRRVGERVRIGVFDQDQAQALPGDQTALQHLTTESPTVPPERIRTVLGALGLPGDMALRPIGALSGGEKARVALASLVVRPCNVLLLDEPTNHLDAETVDVLVDALADWQGALLVISHDRFVIEHLATHVIRIREGGLDKHEGVRGEDFEREPLVRGGSAAPAPAAEAHADRKKRQREIDRAKKRLQEIEGLIPRQELAVQQIDERMFAAASDGPRVVALVAERRAAQDAVDALYAEWEALETLIAEG